MLYYTKSSSCWPRLKLSPRKIIHLLVCNTVARMGDQQSFFQMQLRWPTGWCGCCNLQGRGPLGGIFSGGGCPSVPRAFVIPVALVLVPMVVWDWYCANWLEGALWAFGLVKGAFWTAGAWSCTSAVIYCYGKVARWIGSALRTASVMDLRQEMENW